MEVCHYLGDSGDQVDLLALTIARWNRELLGGPMEDEALVPGVASKFFICPLSITLDRFGGR